MTGKRVQIVAYDRDWPVHFERLRGIYARALGSPAIRIEHIGSTSVPGLAAKPILDIDIVIENHECFDAVRDALVRLGYIYEGELGIPDRHAFYHRADSPHAIETMEHHLYVCPRHATSLDDHLVFRDYLRAHPETRSAYALLKRRLAGEFPDDVQAYCEAKTEFIVATLRAARGEKASAGRGPEAGTTDVSRPART